MRRLSAFLVTLLLTSVPAFAQADKVVDGNIGGGPTFALSDIRDHLGDGYNITAGITFNVTPTIGFQAEYGFNGLGEKRITLPVVPGPEPGPATDTDFFANANMQYGNFNLIYKPAVERAVRPYVVAGMGVYYRPVEVTTPGVGWIPGYCNPWWYVCYPGGFVPVDVIVGERSSTDFGIDFGGGVNVRLGESVSAYFEARYHYIWGPEITNPLTNETQTANGQFLPLTFGLRF
jgi:opacity protein-like surface antigen